MENTFIVLISASASIISGMVGAGAVLFTSHLQYRLRQKEENKKIRLAAIQEAHALHYSTLSGLIQDCSKLLINRLCQEMKVDFAFNPNDKVTSDVNENIVRLSFLLECQLNAPLTLIQEIDDLLDKKDVFHKLIARSINKNSTKGIDDEINKKVEAEIAKYDNDPLAVATILYYQLAKDTKNLKASIKIFLKEKYVEITKTI